MMIISKYISQFSGATTIKKKLMVIIMVVSFIGFITVGLSILINEVINLNKIQRIDMQVTADVVADSSSSYLLFDDAAGASVSLESLRSKTQITRAILFDRDKQIFAKHIRDGVSDNVTYEQLNKSLDSASDFFVFKEVVIDGGVIGYLYLESDSTLVDAFIYRVLIGLLVIMAAGMLIAYQLALRLQKIISEPIEHLTKMASKISNEQSYSLRAEKESGDEIGILTDEFNNMLARLEIRNRELVESEKKFREVVEQSVDALYITDSQGSFIDVNNAACSSLGYSREELLKLSVCDIDRKYNNQEKLTELMRRLEDKKHITEDGEYRRKDASVFPVEIRFGYVTIVGDQLMLVSVRDITERKNAQEKLQQAKDLLESKVNERTAALKSANAALSIAKERAETASQAKSLFLANMSHEIRTPMNAVIGFTDVLASSELTEKQKGYVHSIQSGSRNLLSLINDILDLSKIEAGKMNLQIDKVYINSLLEELKQLFSMEAREKGLGLELHIGTSVPEVILFDELRLRQILINLTNNAIKFTRKGKVRISAEYIVSSNDKESSDLVINVEDTGIGIPDSDQENIFNIFEQRDNQNTREFGGAGLGLAISTRLAEKLNSELTVVSKANKGSCFQLRIKSPALAAGMVRTGAKTNVKDVQYEKAKILLVDDVEVNRDLICEYLSAQPFEIIQASNGQDAVELVKSERPDLVLMDIRMPKMNGVEATKLIKQDPAIAAIPVVAVTASVVDGRNEDKKHSLFDAVLYKPLNRKTLNECLLKFLKPVSLNRTTYSNAEPEDLFEKEILESGSVFYKEISEYKPVLKRAINRGSFAGLNQLLDELCEMSTEFKMQKLQDLVTDLRKANQQFDIERTQKLLTSLLAGIELLEEKLNDQTI